jgi:aminopeptidase-like protein
MSKIGALSDEIDLIDAQRRMRANIEALYPICRSINGEGVRQSLDIIGTGVPITLREIPSGTQVLDWTVPREWNVREAYIADVDGHRVVDFEKSNLHLVGYSTPVRGRFTRSELDPHLHSLPSHPDWVPYRTSYHAESWGFCVSDAQRAGLRDAEYDVVVDTALTDGALTFGEAALEGSDDSAEVLLTTHVCHPSLANDNCAGMAVLTELGRLLCRVEHRYTYRLLFIPATIGSIAWLALNEANLDRIKHGIVLVGLGDRAPLTYKRSRRGDATIDRAAAHVLVHSGVPHRLLDFSPYGYDERQFCSPGFDLPVGRLGRSPHGEYPEYHTSADDLAFVDDEALGGALDVLIRILGVLEDDRTYRNVSPKGEPQLGRRGLFRSIGGPDLQETEYALLWVLNQSDGQRSLLDIAARANVPFRMLRQAADALLEHGLLTEEPTVA